MALTSNEISETNNDEVNLSSSDNRIPMEHEEIEQNDRSLSGVTDKEQQSLDSIELEDEGSSTEKAVSILSSNEKNKENLENKRRNLLKSRSVSFAPTVEEFEIPARSSFSSDCSTDYIDALVDSYKLQTSISLFPLHEEKKHVPKTTHTRLNPHWREHRIRRLMNKLEELSLWDREEELKASQAQFLREQKLEQIQDRQRNNDLCLQLMRQRHESEMESAVLLDQVANNENIHATIARTMNLVSTTNALTDALPTTSSYNFKRHIQQKMSDFKTPIGRYRQFETDMNHKLEKINQNSQTDRAIMRAYSPHRTLIPSTVVPLFSETYASLLLLPDVYSSNRYDRHRHNTDSNFRQSPQQHASSPDYETRVRSYSNRDVRVPLKEETDESNDDDDDDDDDDYRNHTRLSFNSQRRTPNLVLTTASASRNHSLIHSRQPISNKIHRRSLNDDLNALTYYSNETKKTKSP